ncbi:hypothetical protein [Kitasatospora sp. MBT66]|uniref:hypothetical protein n=1 Tax=Kitasatospora sp. MBT66 TaxID=1444769 RepID=UPI0005BE7334|nr:hypothetical protein [Kitasatospora sp. MBT66]
MSSAHRNPYYPYASREERDAVHAIGRTAAEEAARVRAKLGRDPIIHYIKEADRLLGRTTCCHVRLDDLSGYDFGSHQRWRCTCPEVSARRKAADRRP